MSTLTSSQIASFDRFATDITAYLTDNSVATKNDTVRIVRKNVFIDLWKIVGRPSKLGPVMQTQKFFAENGRTKVNFPLRDENGNVRVDENGETIFSRKHVVMYRSEVYRQARTEITGLKSPEIFYGILWQDVPSDIQIKIRQFYFPSSKNSKGETLPSFVPFALGLVLRKGSKPSKGEKRHSWAGFDYVVIGHYGDEKIPTVITQVAVANRPYLASLAEYAGVSCPDWGQDETAAEDMSVAANAIYSNLDYLF